MSNVLIYSTPTCMYCKMAKEFFKQHNVAYEEKDVAGDQTAQQEMVKKTGQLGVPVIVITGDDGKEETVVGFDKGRLSSLLGVS